MLCAALACPMGCAERVSTDADVEKLLTLMHDRLAVMHEFNEGIFNHLTLRVPGANDRYYQIPFGLHWSEVTASCFMA